MEAYPRLQMIIDGQGIAESAAGMLAVENPATEEIVGMLPCATTEHLDQALESSARAFERWRKMPAEDRGALLSTVAHILIERIAHIAYVLCLEQGKSIKEAEAEVRYAAQVFAYSAEEGKRVYGRIIPARVAGHRQMAFKYPIGPSLGLSPWNFPALVPSRKIATALAAGCSCIIKASEETPGTAMLVVQACHDAGIPPGVVNLVFGDPPTVSEYLMKSHIIRKISFTGSIPVGKHLARLAAERLQRCTLELGGHAPVIVMEDADPEFAARTVAAGKFFRNAGQVCVAPTRFFVHERVYQPFARALADIARGIKVGDGRESSTEMGPLANARRIEAMERLVDDATRRGASILSGGHRIGETGYFWAPTVLTDVDGNAQIMNEEPFGPLAPVVPFTRLDDVVMEANRLPHGLAAYAFTNSMRHAAHIAEGLDVGVVTFNHVTAAYPETPFGGVKESGDGREGGPEGLEAFLVTRYVSEAVAA
jgi:NAD-dependent aldehyde dehydrogenases